ncbi:unnamed protein product [Penicillium egyptiacum]|uniref:Zn(2)-C6 fungal-type domain-containing protein n=1 Tax=Penicillium egyptiacum TaxID=1303716 RepID=A0A9W4K405_9EURO|nr:unnamed protein product [Penicillium egyptiacum]
MDGQTPIANGAAISRPPSAPLSTSSLAPSTHPLGSSCLKCKSRHTRCDRIRPVCQNCQSKGYEGECLYPYAALPVTENRSAESRITQKIGAPFSGPMFDNPSASPATGAKRPRVADSSERTGLVNNVVGLHIQNDFSHTQHTQTLQQPPAKRHKISELGSGSAARQPALEPGQTSTGMPSGRSGPPPRSFSPTLPQDEMELRCNLTTEINVQRLKHRNLAAGPLRDILKLLMKAKTERPTTEPTIAMPFNDEWREEDDLMQIGTVKMEKGGRCSRALLSRFENFLYGPLMSPEEKKMQERIICVEECLSSASAPPTSDHNALFLHRLKRIILNPDSYGLNEKDSRIGLLRNQILAAIATDSKLSPAIRKKIADLLDPDGEIANISADSPDAKMGTPISTRKVPPKPTSSRVPSSHSPGTTSRTTTRRQNSVDSLSPSPTHPPPFPSLSLSTTHPPPFPSCSSSLSTPPLELIDPTDDTMSSSFPFIVKRTPKKRVASGSQSSQSNDTAASPFMEPASKKRPAPGPQSNDIVAPSPKRAASGTKSSIPDNIIAPPHRRSASGSQLSSFAIQKKLWNIFLARQAHMIPILDFNKLKVAFAMAVNQGNIEPAGIDPTLGLCLAIACHLTGDKDIWEPRKWYDAASSRIAATLNSQGPSLQSFQQQILQIQYLHMVGHLRMAWETLSLAIGRAQPLRMHTMHGGRLAVDEQSLQQLRLVWQFLWTKKLSLALQFGIVDQSLETFYDLPMPMQSHIEINMGSDLSHIDHQHRATSAFFIACASLYKNTDDLITVENNLRVTRMECPIKWLSIMDLRDFQGLNRNLSSWKNGLPEFLGWKESNIDLDMEKDPIIRRLRFVTHMRYTYFRLRQYRPFFVLCLRLSYPCNCEMAPHVPGKDMDSVNVDPVLALVQDGAIKCITAAQDIVKTLWASFTRENNDDSKFEQLDYLYAAALVVIASRSFPMSLLQRVESGCTTRSATAMESQYHRAESLLRKYEECCERAPKLRRRIGRSRALMNLAENAVGTSHAGISDNDLRLAPIVWHQVYDRLGLDVPFARFPEDAPTAIPGRRLAFGWLESIPVDLDTQEK